MTRLAMLASASVALFALATPNRAAADPMYDCVGVHLTTNQGTTVNPQTGYAYCTLTPGATVTLSGRLGPLADQGVASTFTYTYQSLSDRLASDTDSGGQVMVYTYDSQGLMTNVDQTAPGPTTTRYQYTYDSLYRLVQTVDTTTPMGHTITYQYDSLNRVMHADDAAGTTTKYDYQYDANGRLSTITDPDNGNALRTEYQYDALGRLVKTTDGLGNATQYEYDGSTERLTRTIYDTTPLNNADLGLVTTYQYDAVHHRITQSTYDVNGAGTVTTYQYDPVSNLISGANNATATNLIYTRNAVPAPGGALLFGAALAMLGAARRRKT